MSYRSHGSCSQSPALTIFATEVLVSLLQIRDFAPLAVILNLRSLPGFQRHDSEQHRLGEFRSVFKRRAGLGLALTGLGPILAVECVLLAVGRDALVFLWNLRSRFHQ